MVPDRRPWGGVAWRRWALARSLACVCAGALVVAVLGASAPVLAQPSAGDEAAAEVLFEEGRKLAAKGLHDEAATKFEASQRLDAGVGTLLYLGDAYEKGGRTASAWASFREAAVAAAAAKQPEREVTARARAAQLEPRLYRLTLTIDERPPPPGLEVKRNGAVVKPDQLGAPVPVDPGSYKLEASAPGKRTWSTVVEVPKEAGASTVTIPVLEAAAVAAAPAPTAAAPAPPPAAAPPAPPAPADADDGSGRRVLGLVLAGVGVVGLVVSGILVGEALSKDAEADEHCDETHCRDEEGAKLSSDAKGAADLSTVFVGVGGAALIAGVVLYFTAPSPKPAAASARGTATLRVLPVLTPGAGAVVMGGSF